MSRIRVLRVIARLNVGGPASEVEVLSRGLDPERFEHRVLAGRVGPDEEDHLALHRSDLPVEHVPGLGRDPRVGGDARALAELTRVMRAFRPHIVHTHTAKAGALGRVAARVAGVPVTVHTFHGHLLQGYFSPAVRRAVVGVERTLARGTDVLVAGGARVRDELLAAGIGRADQYVVMAPGTPRPVPPDRAAARESLGVERDAPVVAFVARLARIKRPDRLLDVATGVLRARRDVVFLVVGEGPEHAWLTREVRGLRLEHAVRLLGWRSDVEVVYGAADLVLNTSDNEGMPLTLIEAAFCGVPAVAPAVGSVAEVVLDGVTGLVVPPDGPAMAAAVLRLLEDADARGAMGAAARGHAERSFGDQRLVRDTAALYERLAAGVGGSRRLGK